jgi:hypothetical protein
LTMVALVTAKLMLVLASTTIPPSESHGIYVELAISSFRSPPKLFNLCTIKNCELYFSVLFKMNNFVYISLYCLK